MGKPDWAAIRAKMPTEKTADQKAKRMELFSQFDPNGNGYLSLAEVDKGCRDILQIHEIFDAKPVIMRAFQAAKSANDKNSKKGGHGPDYIDTNGGGIIIFDEFAHWALEKGLDLEDDDD